MKVTIITATYNSEKTLEGALGSVASQTHGDIEHIIIDGDSSDSTMEVVDRFGKSVSKAMSEPDNGIYDALNKGINLASGDIVGILHSDDFFAANDVISRVAQAFANPEIDAVYGDLDYVKQSDTSIVFRKWRGKEYDSKLFYNGWMPAHPTFFLRKKHFVQFGGYNQSFFTAADYELMLRMLLKHGLRAAYIPIVMTKMRLGGQSNVSWKNRWIANQEDARAWKVNGLKPKILTRWMKPLSKFTQFN